MFPHQMCDVLPPPGTDFFGGDVLSYSIRVHLKQARGSITPHTVLLDVSIHLYIIIIM